MTAAALTELEGVRSIAVGDASVLLVEDITEEIKSTLKSRLVDYCYGRVRAGEDPEYYSFYYTVEEFFHLYDSKPDTIKYGLAGELIVHLLAPFGHDSLTSACVYFNKEERQLKKGFDLTFLDQNDGGVWYGEVKSGHVNPEQTANTKVRDLISEAERGLHEMFTSDVRRKRWDAAILDADNALSGNYAKSVKALLRSDFKATYQGKSPRIRALLCAVVMHPLDLSRIEDSMGAALHSNVVKRGRFDKLRLLLIQQSTLESLVDVLRASLKVSA